MEIPLAYLGSIGAEFDRLKRIREIYLSDAWANSDFWIMYAVRKNFVFD